MPNANDPDPKLEELQSRNALHPNPELVSSELFAIQGFFDRRDAVQVKYEMLRRVRVDGQSVVRAVREHGYTRPTYYEAKKAVEQDGIAGLLPRKRGPRSAHKLSPVVMTYVEELLIKEPSLGTCELVDRICERFKISVHRRSVERALKRRKKD